MKIFLFGFGAQAAELLRQIVLNSDDEVLGVNPITPRISRSRASVDLDTEIMAKTSFDLGVPIFKTNNVNNREFVDDIKNLGCDLLLNFGHYQLFKRPLLNSVSIGCLNRHDGLIPYGRGSGGVYGEVVNNKKFIGRTLHLMSDDFDMGGIIHREVFYIHGDEYQNELESLFNSGIVDFYLNGIKKLKDNSSIEHIVDFGTYYPRKPDGDEILHWDTASSELLKKIRARSPYIPSITYLTETLNEIFVWRASPSDIECYKSTVGQVLYRDPTRGILVKTQDNAIWIEQISLEPHGEKFIPCYPIGTCFVSNWIFEISRMRKEIGELNDNLKKLKG